jgi:hypothetical protein
MSKQLETKIIIETTPDLIIETFNKITEKLSSKFPFHAFKNGIFDAMRPVIPEFEDFMKWREDAYKSPEQIQEERQFDMCYNHLAYCTTELCSRHGQETIASFMDDLLDNELFSIASIALEKEKIKRRQTSNNEKQKAIEKDKDATDSTPTK